MIWITLIVDDVMISSQFVQGFADPAGIWRHPHARSAITIKQQMPRIVRLRTLLPGDLSHGFHNSFNLVRDRDAVPYSTRFLMSPFKYQPCSVYSRQVSYRRFNTSEIRHPDAIRIITTGMCSEGVRNSKFSFNCAITPSGMYLIRSDFGGNVPNKGISS